MNHSLNQAHGEKARGAGRPGNRRPVIERVRAGSAFVMAPPQPAIGLYGGDGDGSVWFVVLVVGLLVVLPAVIGLLWRLRGRQTDERRRADD